MLASLKSVGTIPVMKEALRINSKCVEITYFKTLSTLIGILHGPVAFPVLRRYYILNFLTCSRKNYKSVI